MAKKERNRALPRHPHGCRRAPIHCRGRTADPLPPSLAQTLAAALSVAIDAGAPLPRAAAKQIVARFANGNVMRCVLSLLADPDSVRRDIARSDQAALAFAGALEDLAEGAAEHAAALRLIEHARTWIAAEIARRPDEHLGIGDRSTEDGLAVLFGLNSYRRTHSGTAHWLPAPESKCPADSDPISAPHRRRRWK